MKEKKNSKKVKEALQDEQLDKVNGGCGCGRANAAELLLESLRENIATNGKKNPLC